jgi:hypothetical protein
MAVEVVANTRHFALGAPFGQHQQLPQGFDNQSN